MKRIVFSLLLVACGGAATLEAPGPASLCCLREATVATGDIARAKDTNLPEDDAAVPIEGGDAVWGSRLAPVTIVEFSDFQCPFCSKASATVDELKKHYGPEKLRIVFKHYPLAFHPNAKPAAEAAQGVYELGGNQAFWAFHDLLFREQAHLGEASYLSWARQVGVNASALAAGLQSHTWGPKVDRDLEEGARLGVQGTPAFFINGVSIEGAQPLSKFQQIIDAEMAKATERASQGTPRERIYKIQAAANFKAPAKDDDDGDVVSPTVFKVPVGSSPTRGQATALVTIVEFGDFQCPFCAKVESTLKSLFTSYGSDVRLVWKHEPLPFHKRAMPAAELAMEALAQKGNAGFWTVHDRLFSSSGLEDADLEGIAKDAGLDVAKWKAAYAAHKHIRALDPDLDLADDVQATGTPHFFVNGRRIVGAQPEAKLKALIDEELAKAKALVQQGTAPASVYDAIIKNGTSTPFAPEKRAIAASASAPVRGAESATLTITELADFECLYCRRAEDTLKEILKNYPGKVKIVWRNLPLDFHTHARAAATAALEAQAQKGNAGFLKMHELLMAASGLERSDLDDMAKKAGLDPVRFAKAMDSGAHDAKIDADVAAAKAANVSGTPAFFIGPYFLSGAQPYARFRRVIDLALSEPKPLKK